MTVATAPITTSTYSSASVAAWNTSSLAMNPPVSGMPACASMKNTSSVPSTGRRDARPRYPSIEWSSSPRTDSTVTTANEPTTMNVYVKR